MAKEFLRRYGVEHGKARLTFAPDALTALQSSRWPGNVRELQNRVQRAVIMADGKRVTASDLELTETLWPDAATATLKEARKAWNGRWSRMPCGVTRARSRRPHWNLASAGRHSMN